MCGRRALSYPSWGTTRDKTLFVRRSSTGVERRSAPAETKIALNFLYALVVGVGMHGGHDAMPDGEGLVQHLRERCQAVRRTGGVGDQPVLPLKFLIVDPDDHHVIDGVVGWHGQQHALSPGGEVLFQLLPCGGSSAGRGRSVVPPYPPPRSNNRDATGNRWPSLPYRWCSPSASRLG